MFSSVFLMVLCFLGVFVISLFFWLFVAFGKPAQGQATSYEMLAQNNNLAEEERILELHKQALVYGDFDALQALVKEFGGATNYWAQKPELAQLLAQGIKKWVELVESGQAPFEPEPDGFYYMGLLYEQGFECEPDLDKALSYFKKALQTKSQAKDPLEYDDLLYPQIEYKIRQIEDFIARQYLKKPN